MPRTATRAGLPSHASAVHRKTRLNAGRSVHTAVLCRLKFPYLAGVSTLLGRCHVPNHTHRHVRRHMVLTGVIPSSSQLNRVRRLLGVVPGKAYFRVRKFHGPGLHLDEHLADLSKQPRVLLIDRGRRSETDVYQRRYNRIFRGCTLL